MIDTFGIDRRAWDLAKLQLHQRASVTNIAERAQYIKEWLQKNGANNEVPSDMGKFSRVANS